MTTQPVRVLLIEHHSPADTEGLKAMLTQARDGPYDVAAFDGLAPGLARLRQHGSDVVVLDLSLPGAEDLAALKAVREAAPCVPVVVLAEPDAEALGRSALDMGAQDHLVKGQIGEAMLTRSLRYVLECHRLRSELSLRDELTGLFSRSGFMAVADQYVKLARREQRSLLFVYIDIDDLSGINTSHGRAEGDRVLRRVAEVLLDSYRESDIMARLADDEFGFIAFGASDRDSEAMAARLGQKLREKADPGTPDYALSLSIGMVWFNPSKPMALPELVAEGEAGMRRHREGKRAG